MCRTLQGVLVAMRDAQFHTGTACIMTFALCVSVLFYRGQIG